ncbi:MAG TPA: hypothetical protein VFL82_12420 [Thermomicrobiales bacterium]|nr:hypothetical protein [Thermomicrobiales bacterium]
MSSHPFDARDIRRGMDVFTVSGRYLGVVVHVDQPATAAPAPRSSTIAVAVSGFNGESLGPAPTAALGNTGPFVQRRQTDFQSRGDGAPAIAGSLHVGRWYGLIGRRNIPLSAVQNVSLERVILPDEAGA